MRNSPVNQTPILLLGALLTVGSLGCEPAKDKITMLEEENRRLQKAVEEKDAKLVQQANTIADLTRRADTLQALGPDRLKKLYYPTRIAIDSLSGGADYDGKPGDDGVTVYLQPLDRDGQIVKAAGDIHIQLLDLAMPDGQKTIGEYSLDVDRARENWYGRFLTNHYTIKCPWQPGKPPPANREVTIRAEFVDYITGNKLTATRTVMINLPPVASTAPTATP